MEGSPPEIAPEVEMFRRVDSVFSNLLMWCRKVAGNSGLFFGFFGFFGFGFVLFVNYYFFFFVIFCCWCYYCLGALSSLLDGGMDWASEECEELFLEVALSAFIKRNHGKNKAGGRRDKKKKKKGECD